MPITLAASVLLAVSLPASAGPPVYSAVPLVTHDPYFSVWSSNDKLTDGWPRHWSGGAMGMSGMLSVDGKPFRWSGPAPQDVPAAQQKSVNVGVSSTTFVFAAGGVDFQVVFTSPTALAADPVLASESVSAVQFTASSTDGSPHAVRVYLDITGEWCTNDAGDRVSWSRHKVSGLDVLSMGKVDQPVLEHAGDQRKIDWGHVYLAGGSETAAASDNSARSSFARTGHAPESDDLRSPRSANDDWPVLASVIDMGSVSAKPAHAHLLIGYDEGAAVELFGRRLEPLWKRSEPRGIAGVISSMNDKLNKTGTLVDAEAEEAFLADAARVGGDRYARMIALAFRQVMAGHKIVADWDGTPLMFSKENTSNGCMATIDVIYPACPFFLYHNPALLRAQLLPLLQYAASNRWPFDFAPHDMGTYPKANGQAYGGRETSERDQMPVEESGNMLIMLGALAKIEGDQGAAFSAPFLPTLEKWAVYLKDHGLDPANQLCTDDFAGHLARNVNLSAKAVVALGAYAELLEALGRDADAQRWRAVAKDYAKTWIKTAARGDATSLVFGPAGENTWSQKYNLVWDHVLDLGLFPQETFDHEVALYRTKLQEHGLPLDSRRTYTKLDWTVWSACLSGKRADFDAIMAPVYNWSEASPPPSRVAMADWYETTNGRTQGMHTRTVVGGIWMPLLLDKVKAGLK